MSLTMLVTGVAEMIVDSSHPRKWPAKLLEARTDRKCSVFPPRNMNQTRRVMGCMCVASRAPKLRRALIFILASVGFANAQTSNVPEINPGSTAPEWKVGRWLKGDPIERLERGRTYVIEFWATWCGPCREAMPHISDLKRRYEGKVTFVGVSIWENSEDDVNKFMASDAERADYRLVRDRVSHPPDHDQNGSMVEGWIKPAGLTGVPATMIVDKRGVIAWIGHPLKLKEVLDSVLADTWDIEVAKREYLTARRWPALHQAAAESLDKGQYEQAAEFAKQAAEHGYIDSKAVRYAALVKLGRKDEAALLAEEMLTTWTNWTLLEYVARLITEKPVLGKDTDLQFALMAIQKADATVSKPMWPIRTTYAHILYLKGDKNGAFKMLDEVIGQVPKNHEFLKKFQERLELYRQR